MKNKIFMLTNSYHFEEKQVELFSPPSQYVTVKYLFCGICGGDYSCYIGRRTNYPISLGHEFVGEVINAEKSNKFKEGDIVVSDFNYRCGSCYYCTHGLSHLCSQNANGMFSNRGFAQYGNIHENYLLTIPTIEYLPCACFIEPLSCVIHACEFLEINERSNVLIVGAGSIGTMFAFYLKYHFMCSNVEIIDVIEQRANNVNDCFGTYIFKGNFQEYNIVVDCSNTTEGVKFALCAAKRGRHVCIMSHLYGLDTSFIYETLCKHEIYAHFPLRNGETTNMKSAIKFISEHWKSNFNKLVYIYDNVHKAFDEKCKTSYNKQIIQFSF